MGSGSGYLTAVMAHMVSRGGAAGKAIGIEHIPELCDKAMRNLLRDPHAAELLRSGGYAWLSLG